MEDFEDIGDIEGQLIEIDSFLKLAILGLENEVSVFCVIFHINELFDKLFEDYQRIYTEYLKKN